MGGGAVTNVNNEGVYCNHYDLSERFDFTSKNALMTIKFKVRSKVRTTLEMDIKVINNTETTPITNIATSNSMELDGVKLTGVNITGTAKAGQTLTANPTYSGSVTNPNVRYQWQSSSNNSTWSDMVGATSFFYTLTNNDIQTYIRVTVTSNNTNVSQGNVTSPSVGRISSNITIQGVRILGIAVVEQALTANVTFSAYHLSPSIKFQWQRSSNNSTWRNISGATSPEYQLTKSDTNQYIRVTVTSNNTTIAPGGATSTPIGKAIALGDVNKDGSIDVRDATLIQRYLAELDILDAQQKKAADVNRDRYITIVDATLIQKYAAGIITEF